MSLLIKALEKAEKGKTGGAKTSSPEGHPKPTPILPVDELSLEPLFADAGLTSQKRQIDVEGKHLEQQAAAEVFSAKDLGNQTSKTTLVIAGFILALILLIGFKFYSYLQSLSQPEIVIAKIAEPEVSPVSAGPIAQHLLESSLPARENGKETGVASANDIQTVDQIEKPKLNPKKLHSQALVFGAPQEKSEDTNVKITHSSPTITVNPFLLNGYEAFMSNDDVTAQRYYRQVLQSDVRNVDALLGMAAIAARQGRSDDAAGWYGKVLELEPRNTVALSALAANLSQSDPVAIESRIKNLIAQQPDAAYLHQALGNLYADKSQWPAAQQAYFDAFHLDANNPDYAFNLAVSLDQLGKPSLALDYYKRALLLISPSGGNIDRAELESRIKKLESNLEH
jgi:Tfp pilus assembly protein PilF